jgi:RNA polymerase sigma factor (sigma-70 family)
MADIAEFLWPERWTSALPEVSRRVRVVCARYRLDAASVDEVYIAVCERIMLATLFPKKGETKIRHFPAATSLAAWAAKVARSEALKILRARNETRAVEDCSLASEERQDSSERELSEYLHLLISKQQQRVIWLRYVEDRTLREIATEVGVSAGQVPTIIDRALETLRRRLRP